MRRLGLITVAGLGVLALGCPSDAGDSGNDPFANGDSTTSGTPATTSDPSITTTTSGNGNTTVNPTDPSATSADSSSTGEAPPAVCGNEVVEGNEDCDGTDLAGMDCVAQGFDGGELSCDDDCGGFDTSACWFFFCGNGTVEGDEICDGAEVGAETCVTQGFDNGELSCNLTCDGYDTSTCGSCGDGAVNGSEDCDGAALAGTDCLDLLYDGGDLSCAADCTFDTSACSTCGDGIVNGPEACDGADLGGQTCESLGFDMGNLACDPMTCNYDLSGCSGGQCIFVNGLTWCYDFTTCGVGCNSVCAASGLTPVADQTAWLQAQDEPAECTALANAFGIVGTSLNSYTYACLEDSQGDHSATNFVGPLLCSSYAGCPGEHLVNSDNAGVPCAGPGLSRRSICPCE
jgi:hypothetical protein